MAPGSPAASADADAADVAAGVIEGAPHRLGPTLAVVPVVGWRRTRDDAGTAVETLTPLALILARPDGVTRRSLVETAGAAARNDDPDTLDAANAADGWSEARRAAAVEAVFGSSAAWQHERVSVHRVWRTAGEVRRHTVATLHLDRRDIRITPAASSADSQSGQLVL